MFYLIIQSSTKGMVTIKSAPLTLFFLALLAFTAFMNAQEKSEERAVRNVVADFAKSLAISLSSSLFHEGDYVLALEGQSKAGRQFTTHLYPFHIALVH
jgi:hypothetical protein